MFNLIRFSHISKRNLKCLLLLFFKSGWFFIPRSSIPIQVNSMTNQVTIKPVFSWFRSNLYRPFQLAKRNDQFLRNTNRMIWDQKKQWIDQLASSILCSPIRREEWDGILDAVLYNSFYSFELPGRSSFPLQGEKEVDHDRCVFIFFYFYFKDPPFSSSSGSLLVLRFGFRSSIDC